MKDIKTYTWQDINAMSDNELKDFTNRAVNIVNKRINRIKSHSEFKNYAINDYIDKIGGKLSYAKTNTSRNDMVSTLSKSFAFMNMKSTIKELKEVNTKRREIIAKQVLSDEQQKKIIEKMTSKEKKMFEKASKDKKIDILFDKIGLTKDKEKVYFDILHRVESKSEVDGDVVSMYYNAIYKELFRAVQNIVDRIDDVKLSELAKLDLTEPKDYEKFKTLTDGEINATIKKVYRAL